MSKRPAGQSEKISRPHEKVSSASISRHSEILAQEEPYSSSEPGYGRQPSSLAQTIASLSTTGKGVRSGKILQLQRMHGNRYVQRVIAELRDSPISRQQARSHSHNAALPIQRKEVDDDTDVQGPQDWTTNDRESNSQRWQNACLANLNAVDSSQYVKIVERRDFYKWFYEYTASRGYTTRWALAARLVADGAHQIADMDVDHAIANDTLDLANVELQGAMREGNQVIFDNVLPKLKKLIEGGPLKGRAALEWDMQVLAEEQTLIQPMYSRLSQESIDQIDYIARKKRFAGLGAAMHLPWNDRDDHVPAGPNNLEGTVPAFDQPDIRNVNDRWKYGMGLGNMFTPGGSGFDPNKDTMPTPGASYQSGAEFAKVDTRANLHELDAWLNPNRLSRVGSGSDIQAIINRLSAFEKKQVLADHSPDGWAYSIQFAQFSFITEAMVRQALPSDPVSAAAVIFFIARYNTERQTVLALNAASASGTMW